MDPRLCSSSSTVEQQTEHFIMGIQNTTTLEKGMNGQWDKVLIEYKNPENYKDRVDVIARSGDTVLHLAVFDGEVEIVKELVKSIPDHEVSDILEIENYKGNNVLHLAAAVGNVEMCECIAERCSHLIKNRNIEDETPLFVAARHGKTEAFLLLHSKCEEASRRVCCLKKDGDTVLHCTINGGYLELAYKIIRVQEDLIIARNKSGLSPLHILASTPNAFLSGTRFVRLDLFIYHCMFMDQPKSDLTHDKNYIEVKVAKKNSRAGEEENGSKYCPDNYTICLAFFKILKNLISYVIVRSTVSNKQAPDSHTIDTENKQPPDSQAIDTENPQLVQKIHAGRSGGRNAGYFSLTTSSSPPKMYSPPNYIMCFNFFKLAMNALFIFFKLAMKSLLGFLEFVGISRVRKIREKKEKHTWATRIMEELMKWEKSYNPGGRPGSSLLDEDFETDRNHMIETPLLIAAKMGVTEMVEKILDKFPVAIEDVNSEKKNAVLLAIENRQPYVYQLLLNRKGLDQSVFYQVDNKGNSALHLAATFGEYRPWLIPGAALQMQWEIRWYKFVKKSKPKSYFAQYNDLGQTARQVFTETHNGLVRRGREWLTDTSESCSVVAALIATVAFATAATVPGGLDSKFGSPTLKDESAFHAFAVSSLVALCFSVTAVIMFLAILTSRYEEQDFANGLPNKLIVALSSLFISIASMLVSFFSGHIFVLGEKLIYAAYPFYIITSLPVMFFIVGQFPIIDMLWANFSVVPQISYKANRFGRLRRRKKKQETETETESETETDED